VLHFKVGSGLKRKHCHNSERLARDKHSCLLRTFVNYRHKNFYYCGINAERSSLLRLRKKYSSFSRIQEKGKGRNCAKIFFIKIDHPFLMERRQQQEVNLSNEKNCRINQLPISVDRWRQGPMHRYQKSQNRLLTVCCVPATSTSLPRVSFFFSFFCCCGHLQY